MDAGGSGVSYLLSKEGFGGGRMGAGLFSSLPMMGQPKIYWEGRPWGARRDMRGQEFGFKRCHCLAAHVAGKLCLVPCWSFPSRSPSPTPGTGAQVCTPRLHGLQNRGQLAHWSRVSNSPVALVSSEGAQFPVPTPMMEGREQRARDISCL